MNKLFWFFFCILSFFPFNAFESQPPEYGLLFRTYENNQQNDQRLQRGQVRIERYKKKDGSNSFIFDVKILPEFLYLATRQKKPLVIGLFSEENLNNNNLELYQNVADELKNDALFIGINKNKHLPLINLFFMIFKFEGINILPQDDQFPVFLFCRNDFVVLENRSVSFKKGGIILLNKGDFTTDSLMKNIKNNLEKPENLLIPEDLSKENDIKTKENSIKKESFWDKFKKWFKTKF